VNQDRPVITPEALSVYAEYERQITIRHLRVGCWLVIFLMPAGVILDHYVYPDHSDFFFRLRLACSALEGLLWGFLFTRLGQRWHRLVGLAVAMLPVFFISWMIYETREPSSPYYAGLNLILLAIAFILRWDVGLSLAAIVLVLAMYLGACFARGPIPDPEWRLVCNNLYFLLLTGIIVISGSRIHRRLRSREFKLRYELDRNREELEKTNQKLVEMDQIKSRFFANISHELRTPLTLLVAPLETLQHQRARLSEEETAELLGGMHSNAMRLLKLINDLLELVRLDSGVMQVQREPVELAAFIRGLASAARQVADNRRLKLETAIDPAIGRIMVDRDKLEKVILNLQFNALKFTPAGGRVDITAVPEGNQVVIRVKDTGMGIAAKNLPNVFSRFWQADTSARRKYQGVGIGLALVKELTEIQEGSVSVESEEGKGTTFTVRLPLIPAGEALPSRPGSVESQPSSGVAPAAAGPGVNAEWLANLYRRAEMLPATAQAHKVLKQREAVRGDARPTLLIADDEPDMLRFLKLQLQVHYQVLEAADGQQALDEANRSLPDLILLDMMMPEKDGLQVCRELRQRTATRSIPVLLLTARADDETKMAALSAGASDFLPKPFSTTELHVRVRNLVDSYQFQRKLAHQNELLENTIEQLKETEIQLVQSEKLASLGRMSAGIIHEINNPLNYAKTGLYTLRQQALDLPAGQRGSVESLLGDVEDGLNRVMKIVLELGPFARQHPEAFDSCDLSQLAETAWHMTSHEFKERVTVKRDLPEGLSAWANGNQMTQVLLNLFLNSLDALKKKDFVGEEPTLWISGREVNDRCLLTLRDNGPGIPPEVMPKIFEPFYTTKDVGEGTGLGLNVCHRIMQAHGGRIEVESEPGKFCEFALELPARDPAVRQERMTA
jgi:signal transduction histidine kinase